MPDRRRFGRTPDTICILAVLTFVGAGLTVSRQVPPSVLELVPEPLALVWSATFTASAGLSLAGVLWRDHLNGWGIELCGRIALACTCLAYFTALAGKASNWGSAIVVGLILAVGVASVWRMYQLLRRFDQFKADVLALRAMRQREGGGA